MKILTIGLIAFLVWSSLSTYLYVCKIKRLCDETITMQYVAPVHEPVVVLDTVSVSPPKFALVPEREYIYFDFDKSEFKSAGIPNSFITESNAFLIENADARISITGHADAIGTTEYNYKLGYKRAESVQNYFESKGIPKGKIIIESKGENIPVGDNTTSNGREKNRRTEIIIKN